MSRPAQLREPRHLTRRALLKRAGGAVGAAALAGGVLSATELARSRNRIPRLPSFHSPVSGAARIFTSRPDLRPPAISVSGGGVSSGYLFAGPGTKGMTQPGPLLFDRQGEPVWCMPTRPFWTTNFRRAEYRGKPVVTWWQGTVIGQGFGRGHGVILDSSYREVARVYAANGRHIDAHEFLVTPEGTALFSCYPETVPADLSPIGGPTDGTAVESVIQEIDVRTGRLLLEWRSLEHVPVADSYQRPALPYDYLHANSIAVAPDGNLLVSARCTWALYKLDRKTGEIIWRLGGKSSDFRLGLGAAFSWQHHVRYPNGSTITVFDNAQAWWDDNSGFSQTASQSRGIVLSVDEARRTARLAQDYRHPKPLLANAMGSLQTLPDGHALVGWGSNPLISEFSADGRLLSDTNLGNHHETYRAFCYPWEGVPAEAPALAARSNAKTGKPILYVSWNGATGASHWLIHAGSHPSDLRPIGIAARQGFETVIPLSGSPRCIRATALDSSGRAVASSKTIRL
jgi:hypothetical protein